MSKLFDSMYDVILNDIIGDTEWHGETYSDKHSKENMDKLEMLLTSLLERVLDNKELAPNAVATSSGQELQEQAAGIVSRIKGLVDNE